MNVAVHDGGHQVVKVGPAVQVRNGRHGDLPGNSLIHTNGVREFRRRLNVSDNGLSLIALPTVVCRVLEITPLAL